ncbi:restriction endonuclease [Actinacidiphila rubida]|uniref:Restriction system protein n=1 Tax=Actinacidiphila rubida TaxID=310780 RepID=A0A1H8SYS9_9ACTN|nr:restriction endonuclease [Actinacidiphila rubida]SEO83787.1 restriction system protein [Actinacidiphila rubida]
MAEPRRRGIPRPSCLTPIGCLAIVAAAVWFIVRSVTMWISGHAIAVTAAALLAALGGAGLFRARSMPAGRTTPVDWASMSPGEFEQLVADLCWRDGCTDVRVVGGAGDLGADVLARTPTGRRIVVQCKRYAPGRRVGSPEVQRVGGTYSVVHGADLAIVVTTAEFTDAAVDYARRAGIRLVDGDELAAWAGEKVLPPWGAERMMGA